MKRVKMWATEIYATPAGSEDPEELTHWRGPMVPGNTAKEAQEYCEQNGLGCCHVVGQAVTVTQDEVDEVEEENKN